MWLYRSTKTSPFSRYSLCVYCTLDRHRNIHTEHKSPHTFFSHSLSFHDFCLCRILIICIFLILITITFYFYSTNCSIRCAHSFDLSRFWVYFFNVILLLNMSTCSRFVMKMTLFRCSFLRIKIHTHTHVKSIGVWFGIEHNKGVESAVFGFWLFSPKITIGVKVVIRH